MGKFLTAHSRLEQLCVGDKWKLVDNQLYKDDNGDIILCPRNYITDGFTIPSFVTFIAGGKMEYDTRASSQHDFECSYHKVIKVIKTEDELRKMNILHVANGKFVCENIPIEFLEAHSTTFNETNQRFKRMLASTNIPKNKYKMIASAVYLNASWLWTRHELDMDELYEVDYGLLIK